MVAGSGRPPGFPRGQQLVYTIKLRKKDQVPRRHRLQRRRLKTNLDRVTNPENKLERYSLYNNTIAKVEVVDDYTASIHPEDSPFPPFIAQLAHPSTV